MAIVLTKKKIVAPSMDMSISEFAELIDRVGMLQEEAEKVTARIKEEQERLKPYQTALKELQEKIEEIEADADQPLDEIGTIFRVEAGKRGSSRSIKSMDLVRQMLGDELFMQLATVTLKNLDDYLTPPQKELALEIDRTKRSVKIIRRA